MTRIATFYSYKGGTGRSMALANFAWILAASGKRVLVIDWDLEAPGLHRYFRPFLVDADLFETDGLIDMFWSLAASALAKTKSTDQTEVETSKVAEAFDDSVRRLDSKFFPQETSRGTSPGYIDFMGAGRQGATYSERVTSFNWKRFFELGGAQLLSVMKDHFRSRYDWVLIDSRTGVSDASGICTIQMPDTVVAFFTLNRQSIEGVAAILQAIRSYRSASVKGSEIRFFPVATRIENAEQEKLEIARTYARKTLAPFLPDDSQSHPREYWDKMEILYKPAYAFEEVLAAFGDATGAAGASDTMLSRVEAMAQQITGDEHLRMPEIVDEDRKEVLAKYAFGKLDSQPRTEPQATGDTDFLRNIRAKEQLWRNSKFSSRYLLSNRELDLLTDEDRKGFGRNMAYYLVQSEQMRQLIRFAQIAGPGMLVLIGLVYGFIGLSGKWDLFNWPNMSPAINKVISLYTVAGLWMFSSFILSFISRPRFPYGLRYIEVVRLLLFGFLRDIKDYDPEQNQSAISQS